MIKRELNEKIAFMLHNHGVLSPSIQNELYIILNDYDVTRRETQIIVYDGDKNMQLIKRFLVAKTVQGRTKRTIEVYGKNLKKALEEINKPVPEVTADDIRFYLAMRERRDGVSKVTCNNELRALRSFFAWLHNEGILPRNPTITIDAIRSPKVKKDAFSELDVERLRGACADEKQAAVVELLLSTGCRVTELVTMRLSEVEGGSVLVHGKGQKDRKVFLNAKAQFALEKYISKRNDDNPYLFPKTMSAAEFPKKMDKRRAWMRAECVYEDGHMDKSSVEQLCKRIGKRAGVKNVHPHRFRRTCATFALRKGMPIEQVSKMLGHEQISTTQIYLDLDERDLEISHRKYVN